MTMSTQEAFGAQHNALADLRSGWSGQNGRRWLSSALSGLVVGALGLGLATSLSLLPRHHPEAVTPSVLTSFASTGPTLSVYDVSQRTVRDEGVPASARTQSLQRSYQLAGTAEQVAATSSALARAAREAALASTHAATRSTEQRLADAEQQRQISDQVAAEMKARAAEFKAAAEAEAASQRTVGQPGNASGTVPGAGTGQYGGTGQPITGAVAPITADVIGAGFGAVGSWARYHTGLDFRAGYGTPVHAAADGVISFAGTNADGWAGNHVTIVHSNGMSTLYAHMSRVQATPGQTVHAGDVIGFVGATGRAFGPHLHFEVYPAGVRPGDVYRAINPEPWLQSLGVTVRHG